MIKLTLADVGANWTVIARRMAMSAEADGWDWFLPHDDVEAIRDGHPQFIVATRRNERGELELVAKLRRDQCKVA